jgi:lipopolysaccharide/colanic/teichoic acid biosynthesis glycosyltransferase
VRPGLTDRASIKYRHESALLAAAPSPEAEYVSRILPDKLALARAYVRHASFVGDLRVLVDTARALMSPPRS